MRLWQWSRRLPQCCREKIRDRTDCKGIGAGFVPDVLNTSVYDRISKVKEQEAYKASRLLAEKEGVLVGISSGAALSVARSRKENRGKTICSIASGYRRTISFHTAF